MMRIMLPILLICVVMLGACGEPSPPPSPELHNLSVSVNPSESGSVSPSDGDFPSGTEVTLTAVPNDGYTFERWGGDTSGSATTITIVMDSDKNIVAYFEEVVLTYNLTIGVDGQGTTSPAPGTHTYDEGTPVTIVASPASNWGFDHWSEDASGTSPTVTITVDSAKKVVAHFVEVSQTISYTMPPGAAVTNYVSYINQLEAGETVDGFAELTGEYHSEDKIANWNVQVFNPAGGKILDWQGNIITRQHFDINFNASTAGIYRIKVGHYSRYTKELVMVIQPPGWRPPG